MKTTKEIGKIGSVSTLLKILGEESDELQKDEMLFFRGHSDLNYKLIPPIYRETQWIEKENYFYRELISKCPNDFEECETTFERLVKMQHYSLPTRLLDITSNPLVALFFSSLKSHSDSDKDGMIYFFKLKKEEIKFYDSDAVSIASNLARIPYSFNIEGIKPHYSQGIMFEDNEGFNKDAQISKLLHEIKYEKPHFLDCIDAKDIEAVFCVKPKLNNPRIIRQSGAFFLFGCNGSKSKPAMLDERNYKSYAINKDAKEKILEQLSLLGIDQATLFPELEKVAEHLKGTL